MAFCAGRDCPSTKKNFQGCCSSGNDIRMLENAEEINQRKSQLTDMELRVTQDKCTERPFSNKYNNHFEDGFYHCVVCNAKLFDSSVKFKSSSGWPAFSNVVDPKGVKLSPDVSHVGANLLLLIAKPDLARTEVSCANCKAHLGHLFKDGPKPTGLRYCINSSSLLFVPANSSVEEAKSPVKNASTSETANKAETEVKVQQHQKSGKICLFQPRVGMSPAL